MLYLRIGQTHPAEPTSLTAVTIATGTGTLKRSSGPYTLCYGILQFDHVDPDVYESFLNICTLKPNVMPNGACFYASALSMLVNNRASNTLEVLSQTRGSLSDQPGVVGIQYPTQEVGSCAFRCTLLGLYAAYIDKLHSQTEPDKHAAAFFSWVHSMFLFEAEDMLGGYDKTMPAPRDLLNLISQRCIHNRSHLDALGLAAELCPSETSFWTHMHAAWDHHERTTSEPDDLDRIQLTPHDASRYVGTLLERRRFS
jgi:hypothetical protein